MSSLQKKETLLIVDDSKFQRVVIRQSLGEHFNFAEAVSGEECFTIMEKESDAIDLVLLDLNLPTKDGMTVLRTLRQTDRETKVLIWCCWIWSCRGSTALKYCAADRIWRASRTRRLSF